MVLVLLFGSLLPAQLPAQLSFFGLKNALIDFALDQINVPGSLEITVTDVESPADGATDLVGVAVADSEGVWLRIGRVSMNWDPTRLASGQVAVTKLVADDVQVLRQPKPGPPVEPPPATDAPSPPEPLVWPRSPIAVSVRGLKLNGVKIAAGVLSPSALAFNASGHFKDEGDIQSAGLDLDRTDAVSGTIRFDYRRDFAQALLRLTLEAREAAGGLVAEMAGLPPGSATVVNVKGDGPVENWAADLRATIDDIGKIDGNVKVASVQPLEVTLDVSAAAEGQTRETGGPLLAEPVGLFADLIVTEEGLLTLRRLALDTQVGKIEASGSLNTATGAVDAMVEADVPTLGPPILAFGTLEGARFSGQVGGTLDDLQGSGRFTLADLTANQLDIVGLAMDGTVAVKGEIIRFDLKGRSEQLQVDRLDLAQTAGVELDMAGVLEGQALTLSRLLIDGPVMNASADGTADLSGGALDLRYKVRVPKLATVANTYNANAAGDLTSEGKVIGTVSAPELVAATAVDGLRFDGTAIGAVRVQHDIVLGPPLTGKITVGADTAAYGKIAAETALRLVDQELSLRNLRANAFGVEVRSGAPVVMDLATTLVNGRVTWKAANLASLAKLAGTPMAGSASGEIKLAATQGRQNVDLTLGMPSGSFGDASVEAVSLCAKVRDALSKVPTADATVRVATATVGEMAITDVNVTAKGPLNGLSVVATLAGTAPDGKPVAAEVAAKLAVLQPRLTATVQTLIAAYNKAEIRLTAPLQVSSQNGRTQVQGLRLAIPGGTVAGDLELRGQVLTTDLAVNIADLNPVATMAELPIEGGSMEATLRYDSRAPASLRLAVRDLLLKDLPTGSNALAATVTADWDGKQATAAAQISGGFGDPLVADVALDLLPSRSIIPEPSPQAAMNGHITWSGRAERLWALVPAADHYLAGQVDVNVTIAGTVSEPTISGRSDITDGRYENLEVGTILTNLTAKSEVAGDGGFAVNLDARDPTNSPITGRVAVRDGKLDAKITTNNALLVRRTDMTAFVTSTITATGTLLNPMVEGDILIERAEVRLVNSLPPSIATLGEVQIKGAPKPRPKPAKEGRIALDMRVRAPDEIFVRGRGLDSEWRMDLNIGGTASKPRIGGAIEKLRGQLTLLGKAFNLARGEVRFSDTANIDPELDVALLRDAQGVTGGIEISGRASAVKVDFVSTPQLPRGEIMPRLLFNQSSQSLSPLQALELASGIATLLDGSGDTLDRVRSAIGLDVLRVEDQGAGTGVTVGRNVAPGVFVGANQPIDGSAPSARVEIEVFDDVVIESDLGQQSGSSVGIKWKRDF